MVEDTAPHMSSAGRVPDLANWALEHKVCNDTFRGISQLVGNGQGKRRGFVLPKESMWYTFCPQVVTKKIPSHGGKGLPCALLLHASGLPLEEPQP